LTSLILPEPWYLVIIPSCQVSTAKIFADPQLTRNSLPITIDDFLAGDQVNDCLAVVRNRYPCVDQALKWFEDRAIIGRLTGTGACVFATFATEHEATRMYTELSTDMHGFVARGLNRSPLIEILSSK